MGFPLINIQFAMSFYQIVNFVITRRKQIVVVYVSVVKQTHITVFKIVYRYNNAITGN